MSEITLLEDATILDVVSGKLIEGMNIVINGDRIADVTKKTNLLKVNQKINLKGKVILP